MPEIACTVRGFLSVRRSSLRIPVRGSLAIHADPGSGVFTGELALGQTGLRRVVLGFRVLDVAVRITAESPVVGHVDPDGRLVAAVAVNAVLDTVHLCGRTVLSGGRCRTSTHAVVPLCSRPGFDLARGGRLTGHYQRPPFAGGGWITPLVNLLAAGPGNAIAIDLIPA